MELKVDQSTYKFILPALPYGFGVLEPYIDAQTMEIHHDKHHQAYVTHLNAALEKHPALQQKTLTELLTNLNGLPDDVRTAIRNNGGGHLNHSMFWLLMKQQGGGQPKGKIAEQIKKTFGNVETFQDQFNTTAKTVFGSGWAWLAVDNKTEQLLIVPCANQDSPIFNNMTPILGLDVWEHAYYLHYQNRRPDYITAWWNVVNWEQVEENYRAIIE